MSRIGDLVIEAQEFAQDNYNITREEFVVKAKEYFNMPISADAAIDEFDTIQKEMNGYFANEGPY